MAAIVLEGSTKTPTLPVGLAEELCFCVALQLQLLNCSTPAKAAMCPALPKKRSWTVVLQTDGVGGAGRQALPEQTKSRKPRWRCHQNEYGIIFN